MTSQVLVMNKFCAAVASDSSMTVGIGQGRERSYMTADKLSALRPPHNIVIAHAGSVDFLGVPFSLLIRQWEETLSDSALPTVSDYATRFLSWLEKQSGLFTDEVQSGYLDFMMRDYYMAVRKQMLDECRENDLEPDAWNTEAAAELVTRVTAEFLDQLKQREPLHGWEQVDTSAVIEKYQKVVDEAREWVFDDTPRHPKGDQLLQEIAVRLLGVYEPFRQDGDLVFVGFGADEWFPAADGWNFQGILDGHLRANHDDSEVISLSNGAAIVPLAQQEAVHTFLDAFHPDILRAAHVRLQQTLDRIRPMVNVSPKDFDQAVSEAHDGLEDDCRGLSQEQFVTPMLATVGNLNPADAAHLAESLVGLQVLRELTRNEAETVGGPIDVAVLTKDRPIQWFRHKTMTSGERVTDR